MRREAEMMLLNRMRAKLVAPSAAEHGDLLNEVNNLAQAISLLPQHEHEDDPELELRMHALTARFAQWRVDQSKRVTPLPLAQEKGKR